MLKIEQYSFYYTDEKSEGIENINIHVKRTVHFTVW